MKKYFTFSDWISLLQKLTSEKAKIISPNTLKTSTGLKQAAVSKAIQRLTKKGYLIKLSKEIYASKFHLPTLEEIAMVLGRPCYISFESALDKHGIISQMPIVLTCATPLKMRNISTPLGEIVFHHLKPALFNNYINESGILWATAEKALLDYLYICLKTKKGVPPLDELNWHALNEKWLKKLSKSFPKSVRGKLQEWI